MASDDQFDRVREHLANERTYLAWLRTGVATMGFGVLLAKLRYILGAAPSNGYLRASDIGIFLAGFGLVLIGMSARRFIDVQKQIESKKYMPANMMVIAVTILFGLLGIATIFCLIPSSR